MQTIVQDYGPIYGEVVNGTVQGRPNGSVFVPVSNTISLDASTPYIVQASAGWYRICDSAGKYSSASNYLTVIAQSQDLASSMVIEIYDDAELTNLIARRTLASGLFNTKEPAIQLVDTTEETTVYARASLINNNTPVAISDVEELTLVVLS